MSIFALSVEIPPCNPVLKRQNAYMVTQHNVTKNKKSKGGASATAMETPEWPTGDESFYDNRHTKYTWDDVELTSEDLKRADFNEAVYHALQRRLARERAALGAT